MNLLLPLTLATLLTGQADDRTTIAHEDAMRWAKGVITGEFETAADLTHPKIIEILGGREKMLQTMADARKQMTEKGINFVETKAEAPSTVTPSASALYCVIPMTNVIEFPQSTMKSRTFLVGHSDNDGKSWTFIDSSLGAAKIRELFPDLPKDLKLPDREPPKISPRATAATK